MGDGGPRQSCGAAQASQPPEGPGAGAGKRVVDGTAHHPGGRVRPVDSWSGMGEREADATTATLGACLGGQRQRGAPSHVSCGQALAAGIRARDRIRREAGG